MFVDGEQLMVVCGANTTLRLDEVQMEGKPRMSGAEFVRGFQVKTGESLG